MKHIVQILQITAAPDWWCTDDGEDTFEPVALWVHCLVLNDDYVALGANPHILGLIADEVGGELTDVINAIDREFVHKDEFEIIGERLKPGRRARKAL